MCLPSAPRSLPRHATPIVMVPSLINRWYVLDLGPGRSLIEGSSRKASRSTASRRADRPRSASTWDDVAGRYIGRAVRLAARATRPAPRTSSATASAARSRRRTSRRFPSTSRRCSRSPRRSLRSRRHHVDVDAHADVRRRVDPRRVRQRAVAADAGELSHAEPDHDRGRLTKLLDRAWDDEFLEAFLIDGALGQDNVSFPGRVLRAVHRAAVSREHVSARQLPRSPGGLRSSRESTRPCSRYRVRGRSHRPARECRAAPKIESASVDKQLVVQGGGHVRPIVSRSAAKRLWPVMATFSTSHDRVICQSSADVPRSARRPSSSVSLAETTPRHSQSTGPCRRSMRRLPRTPVPMHAPRRRAVRRASTR